MADSFDLKFMASDHTIFSGEALSISLPTTDGRIGILAHHMNIIMAVIPGTATFVTAEDPENRQTVVISSGLVKVENGEVIVLVITAENPEDIDAERADRALEEARENLKNASSRREHVAAVTQLQRAITRVHASKHKHW